jgi:hypothetical protein
MNPDYTVRLRPSGTYKVGTVKDPIANISHKVYTGKSEIDALYYLTFVDSNNDEPTAEFVYTNSGIKFNPLTDNLFIGNSMVIGVNSISTGVTTFSFLPYTNSISIGSTSSLTSFGGDIKIGGNDIKSSSGDTVISLLNGDAFFSNTVTIKKDLYVEGKLNSSTPSLSLDARTFDIGLLSGQGGIVTNTTWDLGVFFNYNESNTKKKSALIWEFTAKRFQFSSTFTETTFPNVYDSPQLVTSEFSPIEISSLWINNSCSAGAVEVIGCSDNELKLQNLVIDEGEY